MTIFLTRIEIGNSDDTYHLYINDKLWCSDLTEEELKDFLEYEEEKRDISIRLVETRETDNGIDYMWNIIVDGLPMYVGVPREFADAIIDALLYRR